MKGGPIGNRISRQGLKDPGFRGEQGPLNLMTKNWGASSEKGYPFISRTSFNPERTL